MRPRGKAVNRAKVTMIIVFALAIIFSLVYTIVSYDYQEGNVFDHKPDTETEQVRSIGNDPDEAI